MPAFLRALRHDRLALAWLLLVAVTLFSTEIGGGASWFGSPAVVTAAVLAIAFAKVTVVMFTFMELRGAPLVLRLLAAGWLAVVLGVLLAAYAGVFA